MEIEKLKQLIAFSENKTLSAAAEALHISQPTLTRTMQNIEDELGVKLFERRKNSLSLTETGAYTVEKAKLLIAQHDDMISQVRGFDESRRTISIGSAAPGPLWTLLPELIDRYPGRVIRSDVKDEETLISGLFSGAYNMVILTSDLSDDERYAEKKLDVSKWGEEYLFAGLPKGHRLSSRETLKWSDINGESMVLFSETGIWGSVHRRAMPNSKVVVQSDRELLNEIIRTSSLISFMSNLSIKHFRIAENRVFIRIDEESAKIKYYIHRLPGSGN